MKKYSFSIIILSALVLTSCKLTQLPKFTSVENVMKLELKSSLSKVESLFGSKPYDILSSQYGGYVIYEYKYKLVERRIKPKLVNKIGSSELSGKTWYNGDLKSVYLFFKSDKLETFITTNGKGNSEELVTLNNNIYVIARNRGKLQIYPKPASSPQTTKKGILGKKRKK